MITRALRPRFWTFIARRYAASPVADPAAYERKLAETAAHLRPDMRLLELGCGTGTTALIHAPRVAHIDALDFASGMLEIAREKSAAQGCSNVTFHLSTLDAWPCPHPEGPYDGALAMSILHLVPDLDRTLAQLFDSLKPGGLLFSSTVCVKDLGWAPRLLLPLMGWTGVLPRILPLSARELTDRIAAAGFEVETSWVPKPGSVFLIARKR